jgi:hypothetical protein
VVSFSLTYNYKFPTLSSIPRGLESLGFSRGGMRRNSREVALSSASLDNSTIKLQCTLFLKFGSHYYREPPAPAGGDSTQKQCLTKKYQMRT